MVVGPAAGLGRPWWKSDIAKDAPSEPFLFSGFQQKSLYLSADKPVTFDAEIDFMGNGAWHRYEQIKVPAEGYARHVFPAGFSAHWIRLTAQAACKGTAQFFFV